MNGNAVSIGVVVTQAVRDPHFRHRFYVCRGREVQLKAGRQHAYNLGAKRSGGNHHLPKGTGIEAIAPLEVFVTEDGHDGKRGRRWDSRLRYTRRWGWLWYSVCIREITAEQDLGPHYTKEVRGDHCGADLLWSSIFFEQDVAESEDPREVLESVFRPIAQIDEVLVGEGEVAHVTVAHVAGGDDQAAGVLIGKRPQQHGIGDTEDRGARANAQGNGQNGGECKDRAFPQCSACECQISKRHRSPHPSALLARNTPGVCRSQALSAPPQLQG